ncbi:PREDICTED: uncharacterized protein LOC108798709 [Nanorana parkeri]|uniref:uncharacterized protein LOC108798709 n=1 Tax=Nanorana parkeri TaxID=125878 RepID=UPI00085508BE|nr:PREDICTED: uncharacterized protein LOC108798709 [Nanorana parkeri]
MSAPHLSSCCRSPCHGGYTGGVTFVLGALDGDPVKLNLLKDYVCKSLYGLVHGFRATSFNIIHFSHVRQVDIIYKAVILMDHGLVPLSGIMSAPHLSSCCRSPCHGGYTGGVTFVLGALDGDPVKLNLLKDYVCKSLYGLVHGFRATSFNIIHFSHVISKWCDCAVTWRPDVVAQAISWTRGLVCGSGASPTGALAAALEDPVCKTVYLVMDALPPNVLTDLYSFLARNESACAVSVVYLTEEPRDSQVEGSFREIHLKPLGPSRMIRSAENIGMSHCCQIPSPCTASTVHSTELWPPLSCSVTSRTPETPGICPSNSAPITRTPAAVHLMRGARVLARRERDALYYMGHIACEVEGSPDRFLVEFEKCHAFKGKAQFRMQETPVCDIIHYEDARWRPLVPGDHVLAPLDTGMEQYGPGTILRGAENRDRGLAFDSNGVLVTFWNGKTKQVPAGLSVWIPQDLSDRITLELHIPLEARKKLMESCPGFPFIGTGYKHPQCQAEEATLTLGSDKCLYCRSGPYVCQRCHVPEELWAALRNSLNHINNTTSAKEKLAKKVDKKKELKQNVSSKTVHTKDKAKPQRRVLLEREGSQQQKQKEHVICNRDTQTEGMRRSDSSPIKSALKTTDDDSMPSSYNPSRLNNMTHLRATLERINQAMKEDRKAMESALLERRPRSAPLKLNYEAKAWSNQELREKKETEKTKLWRMQAEERQRRREEKFKEMEEREDALQDSRRLHSQQRVLLDLERRQNQEGLEAQQAETRRAVAEERSRKKDEDMGREWRKEEDRMKYWREHRQQRESVEVEKSWKFYEQEERQKETARSQMETQQRQQEADLREWHRHQLLQSGSKRRISNKLEQFYRQVEQEPKKDQDMQQYLKDHNLQMLRSAMVL